MEQYKTRAVVLDNLSAGGNRNKVILFTEDYGRIIIRLTGYGKENNHWAGIFDAANVLSVSFRRKGNFHMITGWETVYFSPDSGIGDFALKQIILESVNETVALNDPDGALFRWLVWTIRNLSVNNVCVFLARIIYHGGFMDFTDRGLKVLLGKNFESDIAKKTPAEARELLKKEIKYIEHFIDREMKSYSLFEKLSAGKVAASG